MKKLFALLSATGIVSLIGAGSAMAQTFPTNVVGAWSIRANDTQQFNLTVTNQSSDSPCALITGTMGAPLDPIVGYYCPATGQVSFLRNSASTGATYQVYTGQLSWTGAQNMMTGNFSNYSSGDNAGAFSFSASIAGS